MVLDINHIGRLPVSPHWIGVACVWMGGEQMVGLRKTLGAACCIIRVAQHINMSRAPC